MADVPEIVAHRPPAPDDGATLRQLAAVASASDGHPPFGDSVWRDLADPSPQSAVVVAIERDTVVGAAHVAPADNAPDGSDLLGALVVDPAHRDRGIERALLDGAGAEARAAGAHRLVLWTFGAGEAPPPYLRDAGFTVLRELHQLRVALPVDEPPRLPDGVRITSFRPGVDEDEWLDVNNRAFATDPDQRGWTTSTLAPRLAEPWFEPAGFLLARDADGIAGFCWTKQHPADPPGEPEALGEIYVIGVDPRCQGVGLGRALVLAGLAWLHEHGSSTGMLFVDAANEPAIALYRALGFTLARRDRAFVRELS